MISAWDCHLIHDNGLLSTAAIIDHCTDHCFAKKVCQKIFGRIFQVRFAKGRVFKVHFSMLTSFHRTIGIVMFDKRVVRLFVIILKIDPIRIFPAIDI